MAVNDNSKYLSLAGLQTLLTKLQATFAPIEHEHKLSEITDYVVDKELSDTSTNPVQNKAIKAKIDSLESTATGKTQVQFVKWESGD